MDVNGTKYYLLHGDRDWLSLLYAQKAGEVWWDRSRQILTLTPKIDRIPLHPEEEPFLPSHRRGAAADRYGNLYWISDDEKKIMMQPVAAPEKHGLFWSGTDPVQQCGMSRKSGDFRPVEPEDGIKLSPALRGLVVTRYQYLVAGTSGPAGLLIFDLHGGGPPIWIRWPEAIGFAPFDLSALPDGGLLVLDCGDAPGESRFWRIDRYFCVVACSGAPGTGSPEPPDFLPTFGEAEGGAFPAVSSIISSDLAMRLDAQDPVSIIGMPNGSIVILDRRNGLPPSILYYYVPVNEKTFRKVSEVPLDRTVIGEMLDIPAIGGHDIAFLPGQEDAATTVRGRLFVAAGTGTQAFVFMLDADKESLDIALQPPFLPLRGFAGKALVENGNDIYYDYKERWLPLIEQPRARFESEGTFETPVFDAGEPDCTWHRLFLDACIPNGTTVHVKSMAANDYNLLTDISWDALPFEPLRYRRAEGSELPFHRPFSEAEAEVDSGRTGTWELLLRDAGRYLKLQATLRGTGRSSPRIRSLRVYYPRFSYLKNYLPAVYRDDEQSADFLDRFLANVEGLYSSIEGRIERAEALFDTRTAPPEYLEWLSGWLGAVLDPAWDDRRRRLFIDHAGLLFRWRGTSIGLRAAIRLSIDSCPDECIFDELKRGQDLWFGSPGGRSVRIVEQFLYREHPGVVLGDPTSPQMLGMEAEGTPWEPAQGAVALHKQFQDFLTSRYGPAAGEEALLQRINDSWGSGYRKIAEITFSPLKPAQTTAAADRRRFIDERLAVSYADLQASDAPLFREFLARRYRSISRLNAAYGLIGSREMKGFADINLPDELPPSGRPLFDWINFVSLAVPIRRDAHRFTVLVPSEPGELPDSRARRKAQVADVVRREKPAHTDFDVRLYWALFMAGTARLGMDTSLGEGSRFVAIVLGANYLGQGYLDASHPWSVHERSVLGRDRLYTRHSGRKNP